ncbi:UDP-glycosyltransferase 90A1 [Neltuma alba]|uniref:UDP-glycosyltransferase 90A1 n=1 Tax=Neltuma alba TaxID=207710 RepID=UPI0010A37AD9|nr:UDP-glycosyltransferase 90A1-like [Prosopis alba]
MRHPSNLTAYITLFPILSPNQSPQIAVVPNMGSLPREEDCSRQPHVLLIPFMAKGHTIPLLDFARLLLRRNASVTVVTTPANRPFVTESLQNTTGASIVDIPFPANVPEIPAGVESTDQLSSMSLFYKFTSATVHMQPHFERMLETLPRISFMVSDGFLWWTLHSASKFGIPRLVYYGMSSYAVAVCREAAISGIFNGPQPDDESVKLNRFPWIWLSKNDVEPEFRNPDPKSLSFEFHMNVFSSTSQSFGMVVNSFYELEPVYIDYMKEQADHKPYYCVGPLCLAEEPKINISEGSRKPTWMEWLDEKQEILYIAFGSQAEISSEQLKEIAIGLEESTVEFMWVIRKKEWELPQGFEERAEKRGIVVREWVDQREILMHESVKGFLSHCGWNSVLEGICAGVPILAWPMMAEQHLNAKMVEEDIKVGMRVDTHSDSVRGLVKGERVRTMVRELMEGEKGREVRKKVTELAETAKKAVAEGGSSWRALDSLPAEACRKIESSEAHTNGI